MARRSASAWSMSLLNRSSVAFRLASSLAVIRMPTIANPMTPPREETTMEAMAMMNWSVGMM